MAIKFNQFTTGDVSNTGSADYLVGYDSTQDGVAGGERKWTVATIANAVSGVMTPSLRNDAWLTSTGSNTPRTLANRFADLVNVKDFGADPTGVLDSTPAFNLAVASGRVVIITDGSYYLTQSYTGASNFMIFGDVTWTNANFRVIPTFNMYGNAQSKVQSSTTTGREEMQIYANVTAYGSGSLGAGINQYGNGDSQHAGNIAFMTGQNNLGDARMIISGGSSNPSSLGYRTNTDTRVTIGNDIWDFVDNKLDTGLLTLKNPIGRPALYITDTAATEGEIAVPDNERFDMGHWDGNATFTARLGFDSSGNVQPGADDTQSLGTITKKWSVVYAGTGTIQPSDERKKTFLKIEESEKLAALEIKSNLRKFKFNSAIDKKGDNARIHFGASAQQVGDIMRSHGLDPNKYGFYCYDEWDEIQETKDSEGNITQEYSPAGNAYGLRYEELLAFIISAI